MKSTNKLIYLLVLVLGLSLPVNAQSKKEKKEARINAIKELVNAQKIKIDVDIAYPMTGASINLTSMYSLTVRNDSVYSYLPYYGVAYNIPYGGGSGLIFNAPITNYELKYKKDGTANIQFKTSSPDDNITYSISIYTSGKADIYVTPINRQGISYHGNFQYELHKQRK